MLETGARFRNDFYIKTIFDEDDSDCTVVVEFVVEGVEQTLTGTVEWDS